MKHRKNNKHNAILSTAIFARNFYRLGKVHIIHTLHNMTRHIAADDLFMVLWV